MEMPFKYRNSNRTIWTGRGHIRSNRGRSNAGATPSQETGTWRGLSFQGPTLRTPYAARKREASPPSPPRVKRAQNVEAARSLKARRARSEISIPKACQSKLVNRTRVCAGTLVKSSKDKDCLTFQT